MKIILFDDHQLFSKSVELALKEKFDLFTSYNHKVDILKTIEKEKPDIVLMDIHMGEKNGIEEGKQVLITYPHLKLIFLSGYALTEYHEEAIKMGAKAFINKSCSLDELVTKVELVNRGNTIFPQYEKNIEELTEREKEILQLVANGYNQQEIAEKTFSSKRTISTHMQHILEKLCVHSTVSAIVRGIELGIVKIKL
ncbi:conserved hypothetical protein [Carnobacterium maltaromaticum]|uniref:response regulator transcription factor n=1 Tax=Carnobacterium maltaromaticum TaxID=2751 RepID=UPI00191BC8BC|nr:response regulator transcription factor [Carnobacterium maltaromaticum]CAD5901014.1 conserved hypothetical protein [Carnobacterium maltaromaticum]